MKTQFLIALIILLLTSCAKEKTQDAPPPPPPPVKPVEPPPVKPVAVDYKKPCAALAAKVAQCKKEIIQQDMVIKPDVMIAQCEKTLTAEAEKSDAALKLMDLLQEKADPASCKGAVAGDCNAFISCLVTLRRNAVCSPSRTALIRVTQQEILLNGKTVVFVAKDQIAGQAEGVSTVATLAERIAELKKGWTGKTPLKNTCINADPDVPWKVVNMVIGTARESGLVHLALVSQQLTTDKVGNLLETAALPEAWTLTDDLLAWDIPLQPEGVGTPPDPVTVEVTPVGYNVTVGPKSLCAPYAQRKLPCIPLATLEGKTMHNPVALRQFLYERHVRPAWQAQKVKPGDALPPVGEVYLKVADPLLPYHVITATIDGLRKLPNSAQKDWQLADAACRLAGDWLTDGQVTQMDGNCFYPVTFAAGPAPVEPMVAVTPNVPPEPRVNPGMTGPVEVSMNPSVMVEPPAMMGHRRLLPARRRRRLRPRGLGRDHHGDPPGQGPRAEHGRHPGRGLLVHPVHPRRPAREGRGFVRGRQVLHPALDVHPAVEGLRLRVGAPNP
ncbi:MAG: hypothetical protein CVU65_09395 [Deltaproteobacteria bacterium HGW-Deltaproteobacteria-22]|nr:MAG: hypothetical protein CVU65_09395 [Deltaproteobacteria bacterium HGW-Deltaproteobacteria-22]